MTAGDAAGAVLDVLVGSGRLDRADRDRGWELRRLAGGWSRHTWLLRDDRDAFVVRVKPPGSLLDTDLLREYHLYAAASRAGIRVPAPHGAEEDPGNPLGGPFFVMDFAVGQAPVVWVRRERAALEANWAGSRSLGHDLVDTLAGIHAVPAADLGFLGPPRTFAGSVDVWERVYAEQRLVRDPIVEEAFAWVRGREPDPVPPALVHGDYRIGNTLLADDRITAVVDWELAYLGDPRYDVAYAGLEYLAGKFLRPGSALVGACAERDWFLTGYARRRGAPVDPDVLATYSALGALALLCILFTGIRMYADGVTPDVRMAWSRFALPGLRQDLVRLMGW